GVADMTKFFVIGSKPKPPVARVDLVTDLGRTAWMTGRPVKDPGRIIEYLVDKDVPGNLGALNTSLKVPLVSEAVLTILRDAGVDNLQLFDAVIHDPTTGVDHKNHK